MRTIIVDEHTDRCKRDFESNKNEWHGLFNFCEHNHSEHLFYFNSEFIYFEVPNCRKTIGSDCDYVLGLIEGVIENSEKMSSWKVYKSNNLDQRLKDSRIKGYQLGKSVTKLNFIYHDSTGKEYCVATRIPFKDGLLNNDKMIEDSNKMLQWLKENNKHHLIQQLERLVSRNLIYVSEKEIVKSIDEFQKLINNKIKQKV